MKKILIAIMLLTIMIVPMTNVYAAVTVVDPQGGGNIQTGLVDRPEYNTDLVDDKIKGAAGNIWATVIVVVRVAAVACIVFAGVRYMFSSADQKADLKSGLKYLAIGAILVFCATYIVQVIISAFHDTVY